jgi:hypothetical protein
VNQVLRVVSRVVPGCDHCRITDVFRKGRQPVFQPPCQRMKPEQAPVECGQRLHQRIAAADIDTLVRQYGIELRLRPPGPCGGKHDDGLPPADCDGTGDLRAAEESLFRPRTPAHGSGAESAIDEADEEKADDRQVHPQENGSCLCGRRNGTKPPRNGRCRWRGNCLRRCRAGGSPRDGEGIRPLG